MNDSKTPIIVNVNGSEVAIDPQDMMVASEAALDAYAATLNPAPRKRFEHARTFCEELGCSMRVYYGVNKDLSGQKVPYTTYIPDVDFTLDSIVGWAKNPSMRYRGLELVSSVKRAIGIQACQADEVQKSLTKPAKRALAQEYAASNDRNSLVQIAMTGGGDKAWDDYFASHEDAILTFKGYN